MNVISFDLVQKNPIFRFFGTFNRPKTPKPVPQKIATLFFGSDVPLTNILLTITINRMKMQEGSQ